DLARPSTVYGQSKLAGEQAVLDSLDDYVILRVAWMYGQHGKNFVKTMLHLGRDQVDQRAAGADVAPLKVVGDQYGNPTWTEDIVRQTQKIMGLGVMGLFHATSEGETTWCQLAKDVFSIMRIDAAVTECTTAEFPRPALRPRRSSLENKRLKAYGLNVMRDYREALEQFLGALVEA
ncbi:MAG: sugar nucleotide-binding protein, partial [Candidatus Zixiibacteriota bacterium]